MNNIHQKTIDDFGAQWLEFDDIDTGFYGKDVLFGDIFKDLIPATEVEGRCVADIGSGTGRIVRMLADAGAREITAVEPSSAMEVLIRNTQDIADRITYVNESGELIPRDNFDFVFSVGVIHHIVDPDPTVRAAYDSLKPNGRFAIWLYGKEGNGLYLTLIRPIRILTRQIPDKILMAICWMILPLLKMYISLAKVLRVPMQRYMSDFLSQLTTKQLLATIFDQLNPEYAKYYSRDEAIDLLARNGYRDIEIEHRHGYSWTLVGRK